MCARACVCVCVENHLTMTHWIFTGEGRIEHQSVGIMTIISHWDNIDFVRKTWAYWTSEPMLGFCVIQVSKLTCIKQNMLYIDTIWNFIVRVLSTGILTEPVENIDWELLTACCCRGSCCGARGHTYSKSTQNVCEIPEMQYLFLYLDLDLDIRYL